MLCPFSPGLRKRPIFQGSIRGLFCGQSRRIWPTQNNDNVFLPVHPGQRYVIVTKEKYFVASKCMICRLDLLFLSMLSKTKSCVLCGKTCGRSLEMPEDGQSGRDIIIGLVDMKSRLTNAISFGHSTGVQPI